MLIRHVPEKSIQAAFSKYERAKLLTKPKPVTARLENTEEGICPYCKQQMVTSEAAGVPVWLCHADRAVSPKLNSENPELEVTLNLGPVMEIDPFN